MNTDGMDCEALLPLHLHRCHVDDSVIISALNPIAPDPFPLTIPQGVVLRVLQELGWDTWDTSVVWPEYQTCEGRADFALCNPPSKPAVFIEVKPPGKAEDSVRQALDYAFHTGGVQFVTLTDGKTWSFYLTMEQGSYEERRVYKLDLFERPPAEAAQVLQRYLARVRVESGEALDEARKDTAAEAAWLKHARPSQKLGVS